MRLYRRLTLPAIALAMLAACGRGLPPSLQRNVVLENDRVETAQRQIEKTEATLKSDLASAPDLFRGTAEASAWQANLADARADLQSAREDNRQLAQLVARNRPDAKIAALLADEQKRRETALQKANSVDQADARWMEYKRDPAGFLAKIQKDKDVVRKFDFAPVTKAVQRAEHDWPAKKVVLEGRLASVTHLDDKSEAAEKGNVATLIADEAALSHQVSSLSSQTQELESECGQLYDAWDKVLTDLDRSQLGGDTLYRERIRTVRTHFVDVAEKKTETRSDERWSDVSEQAFQSVENDVGMAIAHKDAGLFDSEAQTTPQPPGFGYVASPSVGSNQYGYWTHSGGESFWTFLPQYLIMRELLWNHDYHPVVASEYNAYRAAQSRGTSYYGRETPTAAPKYGTHGTFTQTHYADSRYVQSGGFKGSAYAAGGGDRAQSSFGSRFGQAEPGGARSDPSVAKRFGRQPGAAPEGHQFGRAPSSRPPGRSFGRRH